MVLVRYAKLYVCPRLTLVCDKSLEENTNGISPQIHPYVKLVTTLLKGVVQVISFSFLINLAVNADTIYAISLS